MQDNKIAKNTISPQHENRRWIFTIVSQIDSISNGNCLPALGDGLYQDLQAREYKKYLEMGCISRREVACVG